MESNILSSRNPVSTTLGNTPFGQYLATASALSATDADVRSIKQQLQELSSWTRERLYNLDQRDKRIMEGYISARMADFATISTVNDIAAQTSANVYNSSYNKLVELSGNLTTKINSAKSDANLNTQHKIEALTNYVNTNVLNELSAALTRTSGTLNTKIETESQDRYNQVNTVSGSLRNQINIASGTLNDRCDKLHLEISATSALLNSSIQNEANTRQIATNSTQQSINTLSHNFQNSINGVRSDFANEDSKIYNKISAVKTDILNELQYVSGTFYTAINTLSESIENLEEIINEIRDEN